jgi:hypothetical protein
MYLILKVDIGNFREMAKLQLFLPLGNAHKVETRYHDNDLILAPIISPRSG